MLCSPKKVVSGSPAKKFCGIFAIHQTFLTNYKPQLPPGSESRTNITQWQRIYPNPSRPSRPSSHVSSSSSPSYSSWVLSLNVKPRFPKM
mmetsp:Transcript_22796/g.35067  ORF Transcript_22796/g.35067 Transcript_22796/m.35067 type:complete len:90 (-) Transcript_22796:56-325(-)